MTTKEAIDRFGGTDRLAEALGITRQAIYQWGEAVPELRQFQIEVILRRQAEASK
jgi:transcriptional repressor of cell division inhibition gene dicB